MVLCDLHMVKNDNVLKCRRPQLSGHIFVSFDLHVFGIIEDHPIDRISHHGEISSFILSKNMVVKHYKLGSSFYNQQLFIREGFLYLRGVINSLIGFQNEIDGQLPHFHFLSYP